MRVLARYLRLRGERRRQMKDRIEILIIECFDLVDQIPLRMFRRHRADAFRQRRKVRRDDVISAPRRQRLHKSLTNFSARARHQHPRLSHAVSFCATKYRVKR